MPEILALAVARGLHLAAALSVLGALGFALLVAPAGGAAGPLWRQLSLLVRIGAAVAWISAALWLPLQAAAMAGAVDVGTAFAAIPTVLLDTGFGRALMLRLGLLAVAAWLAAPHRSRTIWAVAALLAATACALQWRMGHAAVAEDLPLPAATVLHILAAGLWLGGLLPLWLALPQAPRAARRFSALGLSCVLVLAATALAQAWVLVVGIAGLVGTDYGRIVLAKLLLLAALLGLAALNRFGLSPGLSGPEPGRAIRRLRLSILVETGLGLLVLLTAAGLATQPPAAHEQPVWPFAVRPAPDALADPRLWRQSVLTLAAAGAAGLLVAAGLVRRRLLWAAMPLAALLCAAAPLPPLRLLVTPATPTSYYAAPDISAAAIRRGALLYLDHCAACHGEDRHGTGPDAPELPAWPPDLTSALVWERADGDLFWRIGHGIAAPDGRQAMPGFAQVLDDDGIWAVIATLRAGIPSPLPPGRAHH